MMQLIPYLDQITLLKVDPPLGRCIRPVSEAEIVTEHPGQF